MIFRFEAQLGQDLSSLNTDRHAVNGPLVTWRYTLGAGSHPARECKSVLSRIAIATLA